DPPLELRTDQPQVLCPLAFRFHRDNQIIDRHQCQSIRGRNRGRDAATQSGKSILGNQTFGVQTALRQFAEIARAQTTLPVVFAGW
ncbi:MAG TPA: hypothetical protein VKB78_06905, partial [Pirellulales bacterium]|nr:hypothetical protein [Pirellulales bacterium]